MRLGKQVERWSISWRESGYLDCKNVRFLDRVSIN